MMPNPEAPQSVSDVELLEHYLEMVTGVLIVSCVKRDIKKN